MLFPVTKLYVFAFICSNLADAGLVRVKRSVSSYANFDINSLDLSSPEWVRKHLKNKVIQKDAITYELGLPHYEILNPEDLPEIITHEHPHYHENLKLYGHHEDYEHINETMHYGDQHNDYQHVDYKMNESNYDPLENQQEEAYSKETKKTTSGEINKSDESMADEYDDSEEAPYKFIFVKAKSKTTTAEDSTAKKAELDNEKESYTDMEGQQTTEASKLYSAVDDSQASNIQEDPVAYVSQSYREIRREPQGAASMLTQPQYAIAPYNSYQPDYMSLQSYPYVNPFNYNKFNYGRGGQAPHLYEFEQLYRSALETQEQYNRRLLMYGFYSPKRSYQY